ncbi:MAG: hypothetical protein GSR86_08060, partial [Desulfurococcales archaeon]|nr:hypothetical protein [Desulfurococcales archaeon]
CTLATVSIEAGLGLRRIGYPSMGPGALFRLADDGVSRRVYAISPPGPLDPGEVLGWVSGGMWDLIILSPLMGEDAGAIIPLLSSYSRMLAVDVQGYVRSGLDPWHLPRGYQVLHGSREELDTPRLPGPLSVVTDGMNPIMVYAGDALYARVHPAGPRLRDSTGAGDAFTAAFSILLLNGYDAGEAAHLASIHVPRVLGYLQDAGLEVDVCGGV